MSTAAVGNKAPAPLNPPPGNQRKKPEAIRTMAPIVFCPPATVPKTAKLETGAFSRNRQIQADPPFGPKVQPLVRMLTFEESITYDRCRAISQAKFKEEFSALRPGPPLQRPNGKPCEGGYGAVLQTGDPSVVAKIQRPFTYKTTHFKLNYAHVARTETEIHRILDERGTLNIPSFKGALTSCDDIFVIAMGKAPGLNLFDLYGVQREPEKRIADLPTIKVILKGILSALYSMHNPPVDELPIAHGDLKPENIHFDPKTGQVTVVDFGIAKFVPKDGLQLWHICTPWYRPPEVALGLKSDLCKADMFSLGCIAFELYTGQPLLPITGAGILHESIQLLNAYNRRFGYPVPSYMTSKSPIKNQLFTGAPGRELLIFVPSTLTNLDLNIGDIRDKYHKDSDEQSDLFNQLMKQLLAYDPEKRLSAEKALEHPFFQPETVSFKIYVKKERDKAVRIKDAEGNTLHTILLKDCAELSSYKVPKSDKLYTFEMFHPSDPKKVLLECQIPLRNGMDPLNVDLVDHDIPPTEESKG